jgi:hypothetical protein
MTDEDLKNYLDQLRIDIHIPDELMDELPLHQKAFATQVAIQAVSERIWEYFRPTKEPYRPKSLR